MILIVDNYDSFTWNLVQAVESLGETVMVVENDAIQSVDVKTYHPNKIIISPGPGMPSHAGISNQIISDYWETVLLLGVCLGHQCIGEFFGANIIQSKRICFKYSRFTIF